MFNKVNTSNPDRRSKKITNWHEQNSELIELINARKINEALELGQSLVEFVDKSFKGNSKEKATSYNNMGMVFMLARDYELAEQCYKEAMKMRIKIFGKNHNEIAVVLMNLSHLFKVQAQEILYENRLDSLDE